MQSENSKCYDVFEIQADARNFNPKTVINIDEYFENVESEKQAVTQKQPEMYGFKRMSDTVDSLMKVAARRATRITTDQLENQQWAVLCSSCECLYPDNMYECRSCEAVMCAECIDSKFGKQWQWQLSNCDQDEDDNSNSPKCP